MTSKNQIGGFVLAGGQSSRMGRDKALLHVDGVPILLRTVRLVHLAAQTVTVVGNPDAYIDLAIHAVGDDWPGFGPLGGIATALVASKVPWNLVVACDLPYLSEAWLKYLAARALASQADAVIPMNDRGAEPLCAAYHKRCEPAIRAELERGVRKVTDGLRGVVVEMIQPREWKAFDSDGYLFKNMNSPADYEEATRKLAERESSKGA
jgi:molybdenum cofactor guanylyltransferase